MATNKSALVFSSLFIISCLVTAASSEYLFNGFRGHIVPNKQENSETSVNTVQQQNVVDYNRQEQEKEAGDYSNGRCVQKSARDFRTVPGSCSKFQMCSNGILISFNCPESTVFNGELKACVPKGSRLATCEEEQPNLPNVFTPVRPQPVSQLTTLCPRGATYKKAHPVHCARFYDCGRPAMMDRWEEHEWECKYPFMFNEATNRCEHYSMVSCGTRKIAYDRCDYKAYGCNGHAHCRPCSVEHPSCKGLPNGMNIWQGRTPSPYYVVCSDNRVVYSGSCPGGQIFDSKTGTCAIQNNYTW